MNRKDFLNRGISLFLPSAESLVQNKNDLLVVVFLRGGCDALSFLSPLAGEDRKIYESERPNIKVSNSGSVASFPLNDKLGLHPSAGGLMDLYKSKKLAVIQAAGMNTNNRSHFDSQNFMELGTPNHKGTGTGWITRHLQSSTALRGPASLNPLRTVSVGALSPTSLLGCFESTSLLHLDHLGLAGGDPSLQIDMLETMKSVYQSDQSWLHKYGGMALQTLDLLGHDKIGEYKPKLEYPKNELGGRMKNLAQMIRLNLGIQVATVDMGGWDTHKYQGQGTEGAYAKQVEQLSQSLSAFYNDLSSGSPSGQAPVGKITVVVMTEFGRRLRENANRGSDHGHGGMMLVLGESINGGKVYGRWPGLKTEELYERADLATTTDYRTVLAEILGKRRGEGKQNLVFPNFNGFENLGVAKAG